MAKTTFRGPLPGRVIWMYALATMDRERSVYGYALAERISARTDGAWRPGPGAIYPALNSLVERGAARVSRDGVRRIYTITPRGRTILRRIRATIAGAGREAPDLSRLWAEIHGSADPGEHLLRRLHRHLEGLDAFLVRDPDARVGERGVRDEAVAELTESLRRISNKTSAARGGSRRRRG